MTNGELEGEGETGCEEGAEIGLVHLVGADVEVVTNAGVLSTQ